MTLKQAQKAYPLSELEQKVLFSSAQQVWDYIGMDCLEANGRKDMRRSHVLEVVCDAGRLEEEVSKQIRDKVNRSEGQIIDSEFQGLRDLVPASFKVSEYKPNRYPALLEWLKVSFTYKSYGY